MSETLVVSQICAWLGTISKDPIGFGAGDANLYRYVGNHGTYASDPSGLDEVRVVGGRAYWYSNGIESAFGTSSTADIMLEIGTVGNGDLIHLSDEFGGRRVTTQHLSRQLSDARLAIESDRAASKSDPNAYLAALTSFVTNTLQSASDSDSVVIRKREAEARAAARVQLQVARSTVNVQYADGSTGTLVRGTDPGVLEQLVSNRGLRTATMHRTGEPWRTGPQSMTASDVELAVRYARALSWEEFDPIDVLQTGVAAVGLVPAIGLPFDLLNASISATRGDWVGASLSLGAAIPALGYAANARQLAKWSDELYDATKGLPAARGGYGMFGRNVPPPSGPSSISLRDLFIRNAESPLFRARVNTWNSFRGRSPVGWDDFMTRLRNSDFNDYASSREARKSLGFADEGPTEWLFGLAKPLRRIPGVRNAAARHELFHAVDDLTTGLFGQQKSIGLWLRAETSAHLIGGPLIGVQHTECSDTQSTLGLMDFTT